MIILPLLFLCLTESSTKVCVKERDPFYVSQTSPTRKVHRSRQQPVVLGIVAVSDDETGIPQQSALVRFGNQTKIIRIGDRVSGVRVIDITRKSVIVQTSQGAKTKWLI